MSELVQDPAYKRFLDTKPELPDIATNKMQASPPWVVYVQREADGKWGKKEFWKYSKALKFLYRCLKADVHDAALNCKRVSSRPPSRFVRIRGKFVVGSDGVKRQATKRVAWKPKLTADDVHHDWCSYCRRPTVFKFYSRHKRMVDYCDPTVRRCCICGTSERIALIRH